MGDNMKLWNDVFTTDPAATKNYKRAGGFSGTAIKPVWLFKQATEQFGACGIGWGFTELENKIAEGVWFSKVKLWYNYEGNRGEIEQWGATLINPYGKGADDECAKKAITDAVTKCLSYIGFAADIHMGLFDDSKYIQQAAEQYAEPPTPKPEPTPEQKEAAANKYLDGFIQLMNGCDTVEELQDALNKAKSKLDSLSSYPSVKERYDREYNKTFERLSK